MNELIDWDWTATLALNDWGNTMVDQFFLFITEKYYSMPLYILLLVMIWRQQKWRSTLIIILCVAAMIAVSDQVASLVKHSVQRWRPFQDPEFSKLISAVGKKQGRYGFYSAHASTTTALATFIFFLFKKNHNWLVVLTVLWAAIVSYSRIYLGVHFLGDVLTGIIVGIAMGYGTFALYKYVVVKLLNETRGNK